MSRRIALALLCLLLATTPLPSLAAKPLKLNEILAKMREATDSLSSFESGFDQLLTNTASKEEEKRAGRVWFQKPQNIRWETNQPEKELLIASGDDLWNYIPSEKTVYKYAAKDVLNSKTMVRFLTGKGRLEDDFVVKLLGEEAGLAKLELTPREAEPGLVKALMWVDPDAGLMKRVRLLDFYGNKNELTFVDLKQNPKIDRERFSFTPPKDATLIDNTRQPDPKPPVRGRDLKQ